MTRLFRAILKINSPLWFLKILTLPSFYSRNFKTFKNSLRQFIPNRPLKHVITNSNFPSSFLQLSTVEGEFSIARIQSRSLTLLKIGLHCGCFPVEFATAYISFQFPEAGAGGVQWKEVFLDILQKTRENTCVGVSFLLMLQAGGLTRMTLLKKRPDTGDFLWICEILTFFSDHLRVTASNYMFKVNNRNTRTRCEIFSKLT